MLTRWPIDLRSSQIAWLRSSPKYSMVDPFYYSRPWRHFRASYLKRHPMCASPGCTERATVVDHVIRRPIGPDFPDDSGCMAMCVSHHNRKTRLHDQPGKTGEYLHVLYDPSGVPLDREHHWHKR